MNNFWKRLLRGFLPTLQKRDKCKKIADDVKIYDEKMRRENCSIGQIVDNIM
jgi:hypothetical protein